MRLRTRSLVANFAYAILTRCAETIAKGNNIDIETAMSLIQMIKPQIFWTAKDTKYVLSKIIDIDDYYLQSREASWMVRFFGECIKPVNKIYTKVIDCACVDGKLKKSFGFSALDLHYVKKLLLGDKGRLG